MLELTITPPYLIVDSKFHRSTQRRGMPTTVSNESIMAQPIGKGRVQGRGEEGWELTLCLRIDILWSTGNPMLELALTPPTYLSLTYVRGLRICALAFFRMSQELCLGKPYLYTVQS